MIASTKKRSEDKKMHYSTTMKFFEKSALEKQGYYDSKNSSKVGHSIWQKMVRKKVTKLLEEIKNRKKIIDIGCGNGDFTIDLAKKYRSSQLIGVDFSSKALLIAKDMSKELDNVSFKKADLTKKLPYSDNSYDVVMCINVLHHVHLSDLKKVVSEICRIAKSDIIIEIKDNDNAYNRLFRKSEGISVFPVSYKTIIQYFANNGFGVSVKRPLFGLKSISPITVIQFRKTNVPNIVKF